MNMHCLIRFINVQGLHEHDENASSCADPEVGGDRGSGPPPPWKITKIKGSLAILVQVPLKSQSHQSSIQCWATIVPPAKRHLNGVSLAVRWWPVNSGIWILPLLIKLKKKLDPLWQNFLDPRMILIWKFYLRLVSVHFKMRRSTACCMFIINQCLGSLWHFDAILIF